MASIAVTREDIIRMAREAGFYLDMWQLSFGCEVKGSHEELERFASLVAAAEREACADVCEQWNASHPEALAAAIRARGDK